ncbi:MAG: DUF3048 domain-containing protein [Anaerolineales bacterium]
MNFKRWIFIILLGLWLAACSADPQLPDSGQVDENPLPSSTYTPESSATLPDPSETPSPTATQAPSPTPTLSYPLEGYGPVNFPDNVNPLTGLEVPDPEVLQRRPLAVKVNIVPRDNYRPPWGLSFADIIYEYYQNNGMTRFHTIFLSQDAPLVGPIRSARMPDGPLVRMYKSIFAYSGADGNIDITLRNSNFGDRLARDRGPTTECPATVAVPLCRYDPTGENFLLAGTREVHENMVNRGVDDVAQYLDGMFFQMQTPDNGLPAETVIMRFSRGSYNLWEYDPETGRYLRFQDSVSLTDGQEEEFEPLLDRLTDEQLAFDNLVVLYIPYEYLRREPSEIITIDLVGEGKAYAFRDGLIYELVWKHPIMDSIMILEFENGDPYPFKPGTTWFHVFGMYSDLTQLEEATWKFRFGFP